MTHSEWIIEDSVVKRLCRGVAQLKDAEGGQYSAGNLHCLEGTAMPRCEGTAGVAAEAVCREPTAKTAPQQGGTEVGRMGWGLRPLSYLLQVPPSGRT